MNRPARPASRPPYRARGAVKIPTPDSLANAALHYLSRYAASEQSLRRTLNNKLRRAAMADPAFAADAARQAQLRQAIDAIVAKHLKTGALNDKAFAETKIHSLRRAGRSRRAIQQRLAHKGVAAGLITDLLAESDDGEDPRAADLKAARQFARKKRLGAFRSKPAGADQGRKDLAALARAGFALDVAREALGPNRSEDDMIEEIESDLF